MRLIKPSFEIIEQQSGEVGMLKHIETCGRVAWKSEERITDDSHISFVNMLKGVNHGSVLEHGTVYMFIPYGNIKGNLYKRNKYSKAILDTNIEGWFITTNYRVIVDNDWLDDLKYQCEP